MAYKKYAIKDYHIYEDKEILKIENDKKLIEISYIAIKDVKFNKKGNPKPINISPLLSLALKLYSFIFLISFYNIIIIFLLYYIFL